MRLCSVAVLALAINALSCFLVSCSGIGCDAVWAAAAKVITTTSERTANVRFMEVSLAIEVLKAMRASWPGVAVGSFDCRTAGRFLDSEDLEEKILGGTLSK